MRVSLPWTCIQSTENKKAGSGLSRSSSDQQKSPSTRPGHTGYSGNIYVHFLGLARQGKRLSPETWNFPLTSSNFRENSRSAGSCFIILSGDQINLCSVGNFVPNMTVFKINNYFWDLSNHMPEMIISLLRLHSDCVKSVAGQMKINLLFKITFSWSVGMSKCLCSAPRDFLIRTVEEAGIWTNPTGSLGVSPWMMHNQELNFNVYKNSISII